MMNKFGQIVADEVGGEVLTTNSKPNTGAKGDGEQDRCSRLSKHLSR